jgi:hypothetical protein
MVTQVHPVLHVMMGRQPSLQRFFYGITGFGLRCLSNGGKISAQRKNTTPCLTCRLKAVRIIILRKELYGFIIVDWEEG